MLYYEVKTNRFNNLLGGKKYYPLNLEDGDVKPQAGDILTTGEIAGQNKVVVAAERASGMSLVKIGDVTYEFIA